MHFRLMLHFCISFSGGTKMKYCPETRSVILMKKVDFKSITFKILFKVFNKVIEIKCVKYTIKIAQQLDKSLKDDTIDYFSSLFLALARFCSFSSLFIQDPKFAFTISQRSYRSQCSVLNYIGKCVTLNLLLCTVRFRISLGVIQKVHRCDRVYRSGHDSNQYGGHSKSMSLATWNFLSLLLPMSHFVIFFSHAIPSCAIH